MNRAAFMQQLENLLQNISVAERQEALQYYNDYFDDAGVENEEEVIENLGSPASIAENIINDLNGTDASGWQQTKANPRAVAQYGEVDASGFQGASHQQWNAQGAYAGTQGTSYQQGAYAGAQGQYAGAQGAYTGAQNGAQFQGAQAQNTYTEPKQGLSGGMIALIVVLAVLTCPIWIGLVIGLFGLIIGLFAGIFGITVGFGGATLGLFVAALALIVVGIMCIPIAPLAGVALFGGALICSAVGILFLMLTVAMGGIVVPAICKGIAWICCKLFGKKA